MNSDKEIVNANQKIKHLLDEIEVCKRTEKRMMSEHLKMIEKCMEKCISLQDALIVSEREKFEIINTSKDIEISALKRKISILKNV